MSRLSESSRGLGRGKGDGGEGDLLRICEGLRGRLVCLGTSSSMKSFQSELMTMIRWGNVVLCLSLELRGFFSSRLTMLDREFEELR